MLEALTDLFSRIPAGAAEVAGIWVAALLTLAILSYLFGSNPAFRLAEYLFVGMAAGYAASLAWNRMLWPRLQLLLSEPEAYWHYGVFFVLGLFLLSRGIKPISVLGNLPLGVLFGTGAALAVGGALTGSLVPQMQASVISLSPADYGEGLLGWAYTIDALLLILGTIAVLCSFHFAARGQGPLSTFWHGLLKVLSSLGRGLIMVTFGALLAGAMLSFFAILNSRLDFLANEWLKLFGNMGL